MCTHFNLHTTVRVFAAEAWMSVIPAVGMSIVAVQMYLPPFVMLRERNVYSNEEVAIADISVKFGNTNFMSGSTTRPAATLAEQLRTYL